MRGKLFTWIFRAVILWGAQRLIRWFAERYGDEKPASDQPGAGGPQAPSGSVQTGRNAAAAGAHETRE